MSCVTNQHLSWRSLLSNVQIVLILTINMRDQIETTLPGLNVRPDIGVAARVIMQPVRNQFKLLKFGLGVGAQRTLVGVYTLVEEAAEAGGRPARCPTEPDFFRPPMNLP